MSLGILHWALHLEGWQGLPTGGGKHPIESGHEFQGAGARICHAGLGLLWGGCGLLAYAGLRVDGASSLVEFGWVWYE